MVEYDGKKDKVYEKNARTQIRTPPKSAIKSNHSFSQGLKKQKNK
jgi:hypothetical protein